MGFVGRGGGTEFSSGRVLSAQLSTFQSYPESRLPHTSPNIPLCCLAAEHMTPSRFLNVRSSRVWDGRAFGVVPLVSEVFRV